MNSLPFLTSKPFTLGVELELQLVNLQSFNLTMEADDFLRRLKEKINEASVKPEITQSMIELNSQVHTSYASLLTELRELRNLVTEEAQQTHIGICGGGMHPFQKWKQQRIFPNERFMNVSEQYGYLAKQFTVFGQHIHIGCANGDDAMYLCHALARYIPHFIALAASSPFNQGVDTSFNCSRLAVISAFPLSGTPPWCLTWRDFEKYYDRMLQLEIVGSMKDFYWDIRPKPEFGTVELRICDTPLTVEKAAQLAAFLQLLCYKLLNNRQPVTRDIYLPYLTNRFRAARYGFDAMLIDPERHTKARLGEDLLETCIGLQAYAQDLHCTDALESIKEAIMKEENDTGWLREKFSTLHTLSDVVREQTQYWGQNIKMAS